MIAVRLRTEYLKDPLGIDVTAPRLMWNCASGIRQTAYQLRAWRLDPGGTAGLLCKEPAEDGFPFPESTLFYNSGKVLSSAMETVFPGPLCSRERIAWQLRLWDEKDIPGPWSQPAFFELGLLAKTDWKARWITGNYTVRRSKRYPVDCFRRRFTVSRIRYARLYLTACGLYEACLNGQRVGTFVMAPGHTDYRKRVQYQTYDVTALLKEGENELSVLLADGWYRGSIGAWGLRNQYGTETKLLLQLEMTDENGKRHTLVSGPSWDWSDDGPIRFADNKDGEHIDARMRPTFCGKAKMTAHPVTPTASDNVPVTEQERLKPVLLHTPSGDMVLDFGQNIAGFIEFTLTAQEGDTLFLRFGEMLDRAGEFTQKNIQCVRKDRRTPLQEVRYICHAGENHYKTRFAVFGFRYVEVALTGLHFEGPASGRILPEQFTAIAVYSDLPETGFFESSNPLLNRFVQAAVWSAKGNHLDVPTDCPTRERHGWTGDAQIFFQTAAYLFDYAAFARKYLKDVYDWQRKDGCLPQIAPYGGVDAYMYPMNGSVGWSDIGILLPYRFYRIYGDRRILETHYEGMVRYADFMISRCGAWGGPLSKPIRDIPKKYRKYIVNRGQSYGEWAEPADVHAFDWRDMAAPHPEVSTAYTAYVLGIMAEISAVLGKEKDSARFRTWADGCREAYQVLVRNALDTDRQAQLVRPLYMGLLTPGQERFAKERLLKALENYGWRIGTGFLSTPFILDVLTDIDPEAAYRLLENEEMPGWLFMPKSGACTIWESWEGTEAQGGIASLNHYSKGAVCEWLFTTMCGIRVSGERHFTIAPHPGGHFTFARARYLSIYGVVESGWTSEGRYHIKIPANCTAEVCLPDGRTLNLTAGSYEL